jgi:cytochrome c oxidase subunit 3
LLHPRDVVEASKHLHLWIGGINTAALLSSSACVALAVHAAKSGKRQATAVLLDGGALLGLVFLGAKAFEYATEHAEGMLPGMGGVPHFATPAAKLFMDFYFVSTALHAVHVTVGVLLLTGIAAAAHRRRLVLPRRAIVVENIGLYWHLVDAIWVFLYPVLYLAR